MTGRRRFDAAWGPIAVAVLAACGPSARDDGPSEARTYTVRGVVRAAEGELTVQHEAIPDFVGRSGEVEPMHAMTMSFPVAPGVDLEALAPGDPIELDLAIDWDASPPALVTAVRPLPPEPEPDPAPGTGPGATTHES